MTSIYGLFTIGQSALMAQQKGIDITGNNIANVNTPGYSRQRLALVQNSPVRTDNSTLSTGVKAEQQIQRYYDQFLNAQLSEENESLGRWEARKNSLEKAELLFDEVSGYGLNAAMSDFWNAWQNLANNPAGLVERVSLANAGEYLATTFNQARSGLTGLQDDLNTSVVNRVEEINAIADQIADLNLKITQVEVQGYSANDFRDQREQLAFELSQIIEIESFEDGDGNLTIMVAGGKPLVERSNTWTLSTADNAGMQDVFWEASNGTTTNITTSINNGELKGFIEARDTTLAAYITDLDDLAATIITELNALHSTGYALDGSQNDFFTGSDASDIAVNSAISADPNLIAAASSNTALPGDNSMAILIADLQNGLLMSGNSATFDDFYNSLVGTVGNDVQAANFTFDHQTNMVNYLEERRQQIAGVSLDEEMVNLIQYQHAYNSAAKLITTTDELMETLLSLKR
jgi:flagellar hook-associated protein 1 FlgK